MSCSTTVSGETLQLFAERAAFWTRRSTLLVADVHFGKAAAFRAGGIPVPGGTTRAATERLDALIEKTAAQRIIFLGDFLHAREGRAPGTLRVLAEWRARRAALELVLVRGNHDQHAGDPDAELHMQCVHAPLVDPPFAFTHHPIALGDGYVIAGHIHPSVRLLGAARQSERLPCFWFGAHVGVLPAFGDFTGSAAVPVAADDQVYVIADGVVRDVSRSRQRSNA